MKKATIIVMLFTIISKVFGFVRISLTNSLFGASEFSNVFLNSLDFPTTMYAFTSVSIILSMIPIYVQIETESPRRAELYISNLFNIVTLITAVGSAIVFLFPGVTTNLLYNYTTAYEVELSTQFLRIMSFGSLCLSITSMMSGYLNLKDSFIIPAALSVILNIIVIAGLYLAYTFDPMLLPYVTFLAFFIEALVAFVFAAKKGFRLRKLLKFKIPSVKKTFKMSAPIMANTWIAQIGMQFKRYVGTGLGTATMVYFNSANIIALSIQGIFATSIMNVMYPTLSRQASRNDIAGVKLTTRNLLITMGVLVIPMSIGGIILAQPMMELLFLRGDFTIGDVTNTAELFKILCLTFFPLCISDLMIQVFYALKNTKRPLLIEGVYLIATVISLVVLAPIYGMLSLAYAHILALLVKNALQLYFFIKQYGGFGFRLVISDITKVLIASTIMGVTTWFIFGQLIQVLPNIISLVITLVVSVAVYGVSILLAKIEAVQVFIQQFKDKKNVASL